MAKHASMQQSGASIRSNMRCLVKQHANRAELDMTASQLIETKMSGSLPRAPKEPHVSSVKPFVDEGGMLGQPLP